MEKSILKNAVNSGKTKVEKTLCPCGCLGVVKPGKKYHSLKCVGRYLKGKTYEEAHGVEKTEKIKKKLSKSVSIAMNKIYFSITKEEKEKRYSGFKKHASFKKGKTFKEIYGAKRAVEISKKIGNTYRQNPKCHEWAVKGGNVIAEKFRNGATIEDVYGIEKAAKIRKLRSLNAIKNIVENGMIKYHSKKGSINGIRFDSTYEQNFLIFCNSFFKEITINRCKFWLEYVDRDGRIRRYNPDFQMLFKNSVLAIVEVKDEHRISFLEEDNFRMKAGCLMTYCESFDIFPCLYTDRFFRNVNPEPSSLNSFIQKMNNRFLEFVGEKVQRLGVEDKDTNKTSVGVIL